MASKDDDVIRLFQAVRDLELKVNKLEKLSQKVTAIEAYINALDSQFKSAVSVVQKLLKVFT